MPRRILEGEVVSDKMDKTVTVLVERRFMHPVYKKFVRSSAKYAEHDENNSFKAGDRVEIQECRPISKRKSWIVITQPGPNAGRPKRATAAESAASDVATKREANKAVKAKAAADKETKQAAAKDASDKKTAAKKPVSKKKDQ